MGWWLAALGAAWPLWLGCFLITLYLIRVGVGAIALSNGWIVLLIMLVLYQEKQPPFWQADLPYKYWAMMLLLLWTLGTVLVCWLGLQAQGLNQMPNQYRLRRQRVLLGATWLGLSLGSLTYYLGSGELFV